MRWLLALLVMFSVLHGGGAVPAAAHGHGGGIAPGLFSMADHDQGVNHAQDADLEASGSDEGQSSTDGVAPHHHTQGGILAESFTAASIRHDGEDRHWWYNVPVFGSRAVSPLQEPPLA